MSFLLWFPSNVASLQAVTTIRNMACQHREFHAPLDDVKRLRLYSQSVISKHQALDTSLAKAKSMSKHWEQEAKAGAEKTAKAKKERGEAKEEAQVARLVVVVVGDTKERAEDDLARVQEALTIVEEGKGQGFSLKG